MGLLFLAACVSVLANMCGSSITVQKLWMNVYETVWIIYRGLVQDEVIRFGEKSVNACCDGGQSSTGVCILRVLFSSFKRWVDTPEIQTSENTHAHYNLILIRVLTTLHTSIMVLCSLLEIYLTFSRSKCFSHGGVFVLVCCFLSCFGTRILLCTSNGINGRWRHRSFTWGNWTRRNTPADILYRVYDWWTLATDRLNTHAYIPIAAHLYTCQCYFELVKRRVDASCLGNTVFSFYVYKYR